MKKFLFMIKMALIASIVAGLLSVGGCGDNYDPDAFHVFYINEDASGLVAKEYELEATEMEAQVEELIAVMSQDTGRVDHVKPIPDGVEVLKYEFSDGYLTLHFSSSYKELDNVTEVLCRSAVVKTLCQLKSVNGVWFYVNGEQISDTQGNYIGLMTTESFIDNPGEDTKNVQKTELTLYFASSDGKGLVKEVQEVYYNSNKSVEKLIVERLIKGPESDQSQATIPEGTKLISISVLDGICVVNFDDNFLNQNYEIAEEVVIYSIVDSLTELSTISTVQISVNGETNRVYREKFSLSEQYQRNLDLVVTEEQQTVEVIDEAPDKGGVLSNINE